MIFEEFAPTSAQELHRLRMLHNRVLGLVMAGGGICVLIRALLML